MMKRQTIRHSQVAGSSRAEVVYPLSVGGRFWVQVGKAVVTAVLFGVLVGGVLLPLVLGYR